MAAKAEGNKSCWCLPLHIPPTSTASRLLTPTPTPTRRSIRSQCTPQVRPGLVAIMWGACAVLRSGLRAPSSCTPLLVLRWPPQPIQACILPRLYQSTCPTLESTQTSNLLAPTPTSASSCLGRSECTRPHSCQMPCWPHLAAVLGCHQVHGSVALCAVCGGGVSGQN